jgi:hypothetical protein
MTSRIALLIAVAAGALALAPLVFAEGRPVASAQSDAMAYFRANESATLQFGPVVHDHGDATQAKIVAKSLQTDVLRDHGDATQAKLVARSTQPDAMAYFRANESATLANDTTSFSTPSNDLVVSDQRGLATPAVSASSGSSVEWAQLGIGFGLGVMLVAGLVLGARLAKRRVLAH